MSEVKITPLGTVSPYPKGNKNCPGFLIETKDKKYMLDCGNGSTRLLNLPHDLDNLTIIISHLHPDHFGDISALAQASLVYSRFGILKEKPKVYIPEDKFLYYEDEYSDKSRYIYKNSKEYEFIKKLAENNPIDIESYTDLNITEENNKIISLRVPHSIKTNAIKLFLNGYKIVYSSDTGTKNNLRSFAKNADLFICESTFLKGEYRQDDYHLYAYEAGKIARDANVKKLMLTHFWPETDKERYKMEAEEEFDNVIVAEEGNTLVLRR